MSTPTLPASDYDRLSDHVRGGIERYIEHGIPPGGFLTAVFSNDLMGAFGRADSENFEGLYDICNWVYNYAPATCHGSEQAMVDWMQRFHGSYDNG